MCVSYILSSFYYASLEDQALNFLKNSETSLNLVMRLTDDYLLITSQMSNALMFIERLYSVSVENGFRFNTKKLRASFRINVEKLSRLQDTKALNVYMQASKLFSLKQNVSRPKGISIDTLWDATSSNNDVNFVSPGEVFNWIGISIHMDTLCLVPNMQLSRDAILCSLNTNMQSKQSGLWMKRKLKSFLMNNITFYFRDTIANKECALETLSKLYVLAAEKYIACCKEYNRFKKS